MWRAARESGSGTGLPDNARRAGAMTMSLSKKRVLVPFSTICVHHNGRHSLAIPSVKVAMVDFTSA
jgi:hypothetical protein